MAPHISVTESGVTLDLVKVHLRAHQTENGDDCYAINPRGVDKVEAHVRGDGTAQGLRSVVGSRGARRVEGVCKDQARQVLRRDQRFDEIKGTLDNQQYMAGEKRTPVDA